MIATEVEAKTKWCPMVRHREDGICIGSGCMAWRWGSKRESATFISGDARKPMQAIPGKELPADQWTGYCGLAGKP